MCASRIYTWKPFSSGFRCRPHLSEGGKERGEGTADTSPFLGVWGVSTPEQQKLECHLLLRKGDKETAVESAAAPHLPPHQELDSLLGHAHARGTDHGVATGEHRCNLKFGDVRGASFTEACILTCTPSGTPLCHICGPPLPAACPPTHLPSSSLPSLHTHTHTEPSVPHN